MNASAAIVCNDSGDCWHVHEHYAYPPRAHLELHPDNWHWRGGEHHAWREHAGRGYWMGGAWENF